MPNLSNLNNVFYNPGGLLVGDEDGKISKKTVQMGKELRVFENTRGKVDVLCVTETHLREDNVQNIPQKYLGFSWIHETTTNNDKFAGVSIGYKWWMPKPVDLLLEEWNNYNAWEAQGRQISSTFAFKNLNIIKGRLQLVVFQLEEMDEIVGNFYGLTGVSEACKHDLICLVVQLVEEKVCTWKTKAGSNRRVSVVLGGDFNTCSNRMVNVAYSSHEALTDDELKKINCVKCNVMHQETTRCSARAMDKLEKKFVHVNDIAPCTDLSRNYMTYECWEFGKWKSWSGIDHIYLMPNCNGLPLYIPKVNFWHGRLAKQTGTSHHLLTITLLDVWTCSVNREAKGIKAPFRRFPAWLFDEDDFMATIAVRAQQTLEKMSTSKSSCCKHWDAFYKWVPVFAKQYMSSKKKKLARRENHLRGQSSANPLIQAQLAEVEAEWEVIDPPVSSTGADCGIAGARDGPDTVYTNPASMRAHIHNLYSEKFKSRKDDGNKRHREKLTKEWMKYAPRGIPKNDTDLLELCITRENIIQAIKSMDINAAPGIDGIPLHLFTHDLTKEVLADILVLVAQDAINNGRLPDSLRKAVIRLLQKEGKDNTDILSGKRPISLMCIALRILAKCLATALSPFMDSWIGVHQKAYIKGRRIEVNTAIKSILIQNAQDLLRDDLQFLMLLEVDFRSAFDTVDHDFIKALLQSIGIGAKVSKLIMLIVSTLSATVIVNSHLTEWFQIKRGVPQGCSLSGIIFILVLECIFNKAFSNPIVYGSGVSLLRGSENKVLDTTFADDADVFQTKPEPLQAWVVMLKEFSIPSGLAINEEKSRINLLGFGFRGSLTRNENGKAMMSNLQKLCPAIKTIVVGEDVKTVGTIISAADYCRGNGDIMNKSWAKRILAFSPYACSLRYRMTGQPVLDKIPKLNEHLSKLWYLSMNCPITEAQTSSIFKIVDSTVWEYGSALIPRTVYTQPVSVPGGLGAPNPKLRIQALQVTWVRLFMTERLPQCLEEYFIHQMMMVINSITGKTVARLPPVRTVMNKMLQLYSSPTNLQAVQDYCKNPNTRKQLFIPLFLALDTLHQLSYVPDTVQEWEELTTKEIYQDLLHALNDHEIPNGQMKWINQEKINIRWGQLWKVVASLKTHYKDLHNGLYNVIVQRPIVIKNNGKYEECPYCHQPTLWNPVHALFDCPRIKPVWDHVGEVVFQKSRTQPISKQQFFAICQQIPISKRKQPKISLAQLIILCTITEIFKWVREHLTDEGASYLQLPTVDFKQQMLANIWARVSKHRPVSTEPEPNSDPAEPSNRVGLG